MLLASVFLPSASAFACHNTTCDQAGAMVAECDGCFPTAASTSRPCNARSATTRSGRVATELAHNADASEDYTTDGDVYYVRVTRSTTGELLVHELDVVTYEEHQLCDGLSCTQVTRGPFAPDA